jgi:hypothetical protein
MTVEQLRDGFLSLVKRLYTAELTDARRRNFRCQLQASRRFARAGSHEIDQLAA